MQRLTDEERKKLCEWLRSVEEEHWWADNCGIAADEIERLAENAKDEEYGPPLTEAEQLVNILRHAEPMYVGLNVRRQAADEIERLGAEVKKLKDELDLVRQDEERFTYD
jgi:hypothetical protein